MHKLRDEGESDEIEMGRVQPCFRSETKGEVLVRRGLGISKAHEFTKPGS